VPDAVLADFSQGVGPAIVMQGIGTMRKDALPLGIAVLGLSWLAAKMVSPRAGAVARLVFGSAAARLLGIAQSKAGDPGRRSLEQRWNSGRRLLHASFSEHFERCEPTTPSVGSERAGTPPLSECPTSTRLAS
jgi:hypothetical protein